MKRVFVIVVAGVAPLALNGITVAERISDPIGCESRFYQCAPDAGLKPDEIEEATTATATATIHFDAIGTAPTDDDSAGPTFVIRMI